MENTRMLKCYLSKHTSTRNMCLIRTLLMRVANRTNNNLCSDMTPGRKSKYHVKSTKLIFNFIFFVHCFFTFPGWGKKSNFIMYIWRLLSLYLPSTILLINLFCNRIRERFQINILEGSSHFTIHKRLPIMFIWMFGNNICTKMKVFDFCIFPN